MSASERKQLSLDDAMADPQGFAAGIEFLEAVAGLFRVRYGDGWRIDMQLAFMAQAGWWAMSPRLRQLLMARATDSPELNGLDEGDYLAFEQARILEYLPAGGRVN